MCGNHGTITFDSPEYAIREDEQHIRLTLRRSGGGIGVVSVSYSIYPITAGYEDVTSTAFYTGNETVVFRNGQIRASFLVTINDDRMNEADETFSVHLSNPTGGARLGTQSRTIVTIIDDDEHKTCSDKTTLLGHNNNHLGSVEAGSDLQFSLLAKSCSGNDQTIGGDTFRLEAHHIGANNVPFGFDTPLTIGSCDDSDNGIYECRVNATTSGSYELDVYQLIPGGLKGYYYTDNYLSDERLDIVRIDSVVNHTWGMGAVTTFGRDFVSVLWEGYVMPLFTETYTFWLDVDDHVRLWVGGILLVDSWAFSSASTGSNLLHAEHDLTAMYVHKVVMEYREISGNATARLLWSSTSTPLTAIPSSSLYYKVSFSVVHFILLLVAVELIS